MHKLIIDLEMNNSVLVDYSKNKSGKKGIREIIEIGAVLLDDDNNRIGEFKKYVKPRYSEVSEFIQKLTGVTQEHVASADDIAKALGDLENFILDKNDTTLYCWSNSDTRAIRAELEVKDIQNEYITHLIDTYVDFQKYFDDRVGLYKQFNLEKAFEILDIEPLDGAHDALVDAINTAELFVRIHNDAEVKKLVDKYNNLLHGEPMTSSIGSMFDFLKFNLK